MKGVWAFHAASEMRLHVVVSEILNGDVRAQQLAVHGAVVTAVVTAVACAGLEG
jgi:hypothetical protein